MAGRQPDRQVSWISGCVGCTDGQADNDGARWMESEFPRTWFIPRDTRKITINLATVAIDSPGGRREWLQGPLVHPIGNGSGR